jgi:hypothetical protein
MLDLVRSIEGKNHQIKKLREEVRQLKRDLVEEIIRNNARQFLEINWPLVRREVLKKY